VAKCTGGQGLRAVCSAGGKKAGSRMAFNRGNVPVVYLDQNKWIALARAVKLLEFKYQKIKQSFANFLLIEEPEAHIHTHIHTHIQKTLFSMPS
jgi:hypothetical protein